MTQINDVSDHGLESIKKSAIVPDSNYPTRYALRTRDEQFSIDGNGNLEVIDDRFTFDSNDKLNVIDDRLEINDSGQLKVVLDGKVSTVNSSNTPLLANQQFEGVSEDVLDYAMIFVTVYSDVASATDGLHVRDSSDGITWRTGDTFTIPAGTEKTFSVQPNKKYFRLHYTNGTSNQTIFDLQTIFKKTYCKPSSHRIQDNLIDEDDAELVKSVIAGKKANGQYTNFGATNGGNFKVSLEELESGISVNSNTQLKVTQYTSAGVEVGTGAFPINIALPAEQIDAFSRVRVSEPLTRFDYTFQFDERPELFTSSSAGSATATYNSDKKAVILTATTTTNSEMIYQSRQYIKYYPGKSNLIVLTGNFKSKVANVIKRYGQFDDSNGYFFELNGTTAYVVLRSKVSGIVVDNAIPQSSWNYDKMDGTGISKVNINWANQQILVINYQWLGAGRVLYGFDVDGHVYPCHLINNANVLDVLYSQTAQLPIRASIKNTVSTSSTMEITCGVIISEGGSSPTGRVYTVNHGTTPRTVVAAGTRLPAISIRKKTTALPVEIEIASITGLFSSADEFLIEIVKNGTLTGASFADVSGYLQKDVAATAITGGDIIYSTYARGQTISDIITSAQAATNMFIGALLDGTSETITIATTNITANASAYISINYKEIF